MTRPPLLPNKEITLSDGPVLYPTARVAVHVLPARMRTGKKSYPMVQVEVTATGAEGGGSQALDADDRIRVADFARGGPGEIEIDYSLFEATAGARGGWRTGDWEFLGLLGLAYSRATVHVSDATQRASNDQGGVGFLLGAQVSWEPVRRLDLYGRGSLVPTFDDTFSQRAELGAGFRFADWGRAFVAYRWWRFEHDADNDRRTDLSNHFDIRTNGVVLGVELRF